MFKRLIALLAVFFSIAPAAQAQTYPDKPIKIVVPYTAGGSVDQVAREIGAQLKEKLGQTVVVENKAGASANIGADYVAKSNPDGYTLLMSAATTLAVGPSLFKDLPYSAPRDLIPVASIAAQPNVLVVHPSVKVDSVVEFIALAKAQPDKINYAIASVGGPQHLSGELFMMITDTRLTRVPYKGGANAVTDLLGGQVDAMFAVLPEVIPFLQADKLRPLAVTTRTRTPLLPDVPSMQEAGLKDYELIGWIGLAAPSQTPNAVLTRINTAVNEILAEASFQKRLSAMGLDPMGGTQSEFKTFVDKETAKYKRLIEVAGIQPL